MKCLGISPVRFKWSNSGNRPCKNTLHASNLQASIKIVMPSNLLINIEHLTFHSILPV